MSFLSRIGTGGVVRSALLVAALSAAPACVRGPGAMLVAMAGTAIVTAAIVSAVSPPPPPRVVVVPPPHPGYVWQPGFWTRRGGQWIWVDGYWIVAQPRYRWVPTRWEPLPDGTWQLAPGRWVPTF